MSKTLRVGILGATGAVGQRFIELLADHPSFEVVDLCASESSAGKPYQEAADWRMAVPMPENVKNITVRTCEPGPELDLVFSALPSEQADEVEPMFAEKGVPVVSNASAFRMAPDVPLVIPEVNPDHTAMIKTQREKRGWKGFIVTNPNCSAIGIVPVLKALQDHYGLEQVNVVTMQARSGAGFAGPSDEVMNDNVLPYIGGEEDKLETEPRKLLGRFNGSGIDEAEITLSASCHRVNVTDGHLETISVKLTNPPADAEVLKKALAAYQGTAAHYNLSYSPEKLIIVHDDDMRPQPKLDRDAGRGMSVHVGRVRACPLFHYKMEVLSHNTIRGAAGAAILNAELLVAQGFI